MPKPTFENLPEAKRALIIELAAEEFAAHPYRQASLSRIVARAGIAKGSVYQYFDNKLDLYRWLMTEELPRQKLAFLAAHSAPAAPGLFGLIEAQMHAGVRFGLERPHLSRLGERVSEPSGDPEVDALHASLMRQGHATMRAALVDAQARGELRASLDPDHGAALLLHGLRELFNDAIQRELGVSAYAYMADPEQAERLPKKRLHALIAGVLDVLRLGLAGEAP